MKDVTKLLTKEAILQEFELATTGMDFTAEGAEEMRLIFYTYFVAGVLYAQSVLSPADTEVFLSQTQEELHLALNKAIGDKQNPDIH